MEILIDNATVVNEGRRFKGAVAIEDDRIKDIIIGEGTPRGRFDKVVDAAGCFVLPGVIDDHVHFREPGLTAKADIASETRAAVYGGVTSFFDMPNTVPQTTTLEALEAKYGLAARESRVNYSFFFGATNTNADLFGSLDVRRIPGMPVLVMAHCEDTGLINANMARAKGMYGDDPDVVHHAEIRSAEACYRSTEHAVRLARRFGTRLHVAHVTTARELSLFEPWLDDVPQVTAEAVVAHLLFTEADYSRLGARIKCNPAVKSAADREALRRALTDGRIAVVGTDHAPHLLTDKLGGCCRAGAAHRSVVEKNRGTGSGIDPGGYGPGGCRVSVECWKKCLYETAYSGRGFPAGNGRSTGFGAILPRRRCGCWSTCCAGGATRSSGSVTICGMFARWSSSRRGSRRSIRANRLHSGSTRCAEDKATPATGSRANAPPAASA